jgi:hypothetical protein
VVNSPRYAGLFCCFAFALPHARPQFQPAGSGVVVLFILLVAGVFFPFQPLDPAWQSRLTAALVNAATLPLLALALLELARHLDPEDPLIRGRQRRLAQLAIAASR